jgi:hypothetical protein
MSNYGEYRSKEDKGILILIYQAFIHLTAWLKPHRKKTLDHKKV